MRLQYLFFGFKNPVFSASHRSRPHINSQYSFYDVHYATQGGTSIPREILDEMNVFHDKQTKGTIDIWWLYDSGGLTVLLPYIISTRANWSNCKIRVFALTNRKQELEIEERKYVVKLNLKFCIKFLKYFLKHGKFVGKTSH